MKTKKKKKKNEVEKREELQEELSTENWFKIACHWKCKTIFKRILEKHMLEGIPSKQENNGTVLNYSKHAKYYIR